MQVFTSLATSQMDSLIDLPLIMEAAMFAWIKHRNQRRKDITSTPYVNHVIGVAYNVVSIGKVYDTAIVCAALLHDTLEDTDTTYDELIQTFNREIADIVKECTDDKSLPKEERKRLQIVNAPHKSTQAAIVKMADKLYNLKDLITNPPADWSNERIVEYFNWANNVVVNLFHANKNLTDALNEIFNEMLC